MNSYKLFCYCTFCILLHFADWDTFCMWFLLYTFYICKCEIIFLFSSSRILPLSPFHLPSSDFKKCSLPTGEDFGPKQHSWDDHWEGWHLHQADQGGKWSIRSDLSEGQRSVSGWTVHHSHLWVRFSCYSLFV